MDIFVKMEVSELKTCFDDAKWVGEEGAEDPSEGRSPEILKS